MSHKVTLSLRAHLKKLALVRQHPSSGFQDGGGGATLKTYEHFLFFLLREMVLELPVFTGGHLQMKILNSDTQLQACFPW